MGIDLAHTTSKPANWGLIMPLFDFYCPVCDKTSEIMVRGDSQAQCPSCGGLQMEKRISLSVTSPSKVEAFRQKSRERADREGHFSNYSPAERNKILKG